MEGSAVAEFPQSLQSHHRDPLSASRSFVHGACGVRCTWTEGAGVGGGLCGGGLSHGGVGGKGCGEWDLFRADGGGRLRGGAENGANPVNAIKQRFVKAVLGYGVAIYSGAYVLISDNESSQNRHSLASNGALDWSSPERVGMYLHKPGVRKTHWEFIHNGVDSNDLSHYELCAVDTHPGMDGTFVVEGNLFENLRHGVGIRDRSGLIQGNLFRNLRTLTNFRPVVAISIRYGTHNKIQVEDCMPHDIEVKGNVFQMKEGVEYEKVQVGKAENIVIDGKLVPETKVERPALPPIPRLQEMGEDGVLITPGDVFKIRDPNGYALAFLHRERRPDAIRDHSGICENGIASGRPV